MKRVGILTYFWGTNPGTALQAYSTLTLLQSHMPNANVQIINYQPKKVPRKYLLNYFDLENSVRYHKLTSIYNAFRKNELHLRGPCLFSRDLVEAGEFIGNQYDLISVGSDTVWEIRSLEHKNLAPFPNVYWLPSMIQAMKVSFSASADATTLDQLDHATIDEMRTVLDGFDLIGVRDDMTQTIAEKLLDRRKDRVTRTPDPTFSYSIRNAGAWDALAGIGLQSNKPIAAVKLSPMGGIRKKTIAHLQNNGYQVVSFDRVEGGRNLFTLPALNPHQWAEAYKYFSLCVTDRFHGTVFSLKNLTPVLAIDCSPIRITPQGDSKTSSLLKEFGLEGVAHLKHDAIEKDPDLLYKAIDRVVSDYDSQQVKKKLVEMEDRCNRFAKQIAGLLDEQNTNSIEG